MKLGVIAAQIKAANTVFAQNIAGTAEFALAQEFTVDSVETAFVIPLAEGANDNEYDGTTNQMILERFGIAVALKNDAATTDKLGIGAFDRLYNIRKQFFACLLGWVVPGSEMPVYYKGGRLLDINPAWLWWQFEFQMETHITNSADGIDSSIGLTYPTLAAFATQYVLGSDPAIPAMKALSDAGVKQLPTNLLNPELTLAELFGPQYPFNRAFGTGYDTLEIEGAK